MYAINLADYTAHRDDLGLSVLLAPVTRAKQMIICQQNRIDGIGLVLNCDDERAAAIVKIIRLRYAKHQLRFHARGEGKTWKNI
jgi:hypothetical protein